MRSRSSVPPTHVDGTRLWVVFGSARAEGVDRYPASAAAGVLSLAVLTAAAAGAVGWHRR